MKPDKAFGAVSCERGPSTFCITLHTLWPIPFSNPLSLTFPFTLAALFLLSLPALWIGWAKITWNATARLLSREKDLTCSAAMHMVRLTRKQPHQHQILFKHLVAASHTYNRNFRRFTTFCYALCVASCSLWLKLKEVLRAAVLCWC